MFHKIGDYECDWARNTGHAMHKYIRFFPWLVDKISGGLKMHADIVVLVVFPWNIEQVRDMLLGMADMNVLAGSQYGLYFES